MMTMTTTAPRAGGEEGGSGGTSGVMIVAIIAGVLLVGCVVIGILVALLLPAVSKVRESAARMNDQNNMKQLSLGTHNYVDANITLPPATGEGELARLPPAVHRAGQPVQAVQNRRIVG